MSSRGEHWSLVERGPETPQIRFAPNTLLILINIFWENSRVKKVIPHFAIVLVDAHSL